MTSPSPNVFKTLAVAGLIAILVCVGVSANPNRRSGDIQVHFSAGNHSHSSIMLFISAHPRFWAPCDSDSTASSI